MPPDGVEPDPGGCPVVGGHQHGDAADHVFQHGQAVAQVTLELHPEFGVRTAGDDGHLLDHPRHHETGGDHQRRDRRRAEILDVGTG